MDEKKFKWALQIVEETFFYDYKVMTSPVVIRIELCKYNSSSFAEKFISLQENEMGAFVAIIKYTESPMTVQVPSRNVSIHMQSSRFAESKVYPLHEKDVSSLGCIGF